MGEGSVADKARLEAVAADFGRVFGRGVENFYSAPGRVELGGNHTDHQGGCVLAAAIELDLLAAAGPNDQNELRIFSEGRLIRIELAKLAPRPEEAGMSASLARGVAAGLAQRGVKIAGADLLIHSRLSVGLGLSSSAAFANLIATALNFEFHAGRLAPQLIAQLSQEAENVYFAKPCGMMDQLASALGGVVLMDFTPQNSARTPGPPCPAAPASTQNSTAPLARQISFDLASCGHELVLVHTGGSHADLTADYAAIPEEMGAVAGMFGKKILGEVAEGDFFAALSGLIRAASADAKATQKGLNLRGLVRAFHFFAESKRAREEAEALEGGDFEKFLKLVRESGSSSFKYLQNIFPAAKPQKQELALALALGEKILAGRGAVRVHGGGFAGGILAVVSEDVLGNFVEKMEGFFGRGACLILKIRKEGVCKIAG